MNSNKTWLEPKNNTENDANGTDIETLRYQIKTEEKIKELEAKYQELAKKNGIISNDREVSETSESQNNIEVKLS